MSALAESTAGGIAPTPTGLWPDEVARLDEQQTRLLAAWHETVAGDNDGRAWWPNAIRRMPLESRLVLAMDDEKDRAWRRREKIRCEESVTYLVDSYGSMQPEVGEPIPFDMWPEQRDVLGSFIRALRIIILKARQLGLTWLALHYALWVMGFNKRTRTNARVLALSKTGGDAQKLLQRIRKINSLLPPYLRFEEDKETRGSNTRFKLKGHGEIRSLMSTPDAARSETATLALVDEFGHIRNKQAGETWTALQPTLGRFGQAIVIFTGNGPAETPGNGQGAARLWERARSGITKMVAVFLPSSIHPDRDEAWHEEKRKEFLTDDEFEQEYPETEEQALAGHQGIKVYSPQGINAAVKLGMKYDELLKRRRMPEPYGGTLALAIDWGELTHMLTLWPLEGGGVYVAPGETASAKRPFEVAEATRMHMDKIVRLGVQRAHFEEDHDTWNVEPLIGVSRFDAAGVQSQRTHLRILEENVHEKKRETPEPIVDGMPFIFHFQAKRIGDRFTVVPGPVPFNKYKDEGKNYLKRLFNRTALLGEEDFTEVGIIAISPQNEVLIRQLRGLEVKDDGSGKIEKGDDHGPDALIAGVARMAKTFRGDD